MMAGAAFETASPGGPGSTGRWSGRGHALAWAVGLGLLAGSVAIAANIAVLDGFDQIGIVTARGGLQKLARAWFSEPLERAGVGGTHTTMALIGFRGGDGSVTQLGRR